ncbi:MAG: RDD family protein [Thermoplasmata archaeon]|nr:RDD family protein [Thermoplasmata archaeon]
MNLIETYLAALTTFMLPVLIFIVFYIGTFDFSRSFNALFITKKEFYLLLFGSVLGILGNIPLIMYGDTFLGINIGGGVIPIVLAFYFFKKRFRLEMMELVLFATLIVVLSGIYTLILNFHLVAWLSPYAPYKIHLAIAVFVGVTLGIGIAWLIRLKKVVKAELLYALFVFQVVAFATYKVTNYFPELGIAAKFPYYLLPPVLGALVTLIFFRGKPEGLLFGYTTSTLGVLVGADIYHLPEIYATSNVFAGAIGGAATMDMVFLGGLITFLVLLPFCGKKFWDYSPSFSRFNRVEFRVRMLLNDAWALYNSGKYREAAGKGIEAIESFYNLVAKEKKGVEEFLAEHGKYYALHDLKMLRAEAQNEGLTQYDAYRALVAVYYILGEIETTRMGKYGDLGRRSVAYLIDVGISLLIILPFAFAASFFILKSPTEVNEVLLVAFSSLVGAVCFLYFTLCEYFAGRTIGKRLMNLQVKEIYGEKIGITAAMMRNLTRFIAIMLLSTGISYFLIPDMVAQVLGVVLVFLFILASGFSMLFIIRSRHAQRLGDVLAETVVVNMKQ